MENQNIGIGTSVKHPEYGTGVIIQIKQDTYVISFVNYGVSEIKKAYEELEFINIIDPPEDIVSFDEIEQALTNILRKFSDIQETVTIADKWKGGKLIMEPGRDDLQGKEVPIDTFFHKIVMVRDRLRTLEQTINSSKLEESDKITIQQYITRAYGSLTSFNVLFKYKEDYFVGQKSK